ncbi:MULTISPECIES: lipase family alpha/beta hydrolase [unclassified Nocardioides]|uniref:lipase family alpha/beta hydrolase n=1 Tax=unclassified Nocardioides TaxID=2615069 RepID=UPI0006FEEE6B|nr:MULTISPECIES: alpha/beta fold hydrolase [unclassified Nocardioides]KQY56294.1 lipase [Nocardioides sp. Root140]KQZ75078.1 lipase [Nocardioides sp. Root151]KRF14153.1 lipase [Nocardioides sp. Soil796]
MRRLSLLLASLLGFALLGLLPVSPASAAGDGFPLPLPTSPAGDPPGANDWNCKPTAKRPTPVILVHGTFGDRKNLLENLSKAIKAAGFCVFSLDYGNRGTGDVATSAKALKAYVAKVRNATGAAKVSLVGHSQGGMMPRYYLKFLGGAAVVDDLVGIAPSNHGTDQIGRLAPLMGVVGPLLDVVCRACSQQATDSPFLQRLNAGDETPGTVSYTQITTRYDEVVVPHTSGYLRAGPRTTNLTVQNACPLELSEHVLIPTSKPAVSWTLDALTHAGPARATFKPAC